MAVVPQKAVDKIQFYERHDGPWTQNCLAIGTTAQEVASLKTLTTAARAALSAQEAAKDAQKAATINLNDAVAAMAKFGSDIILKIRAKARSVGGDSVYALAEIPAPATPSPVPPPGEPYKFESNLDKAGQLHFTWKCDNPAGASGTIYQIWRRLPGETEFSYLAGCGAKEYTDTSIPAGTATVTYQIQAIRSTAEGPWGEFNVNFAKGNGEVTVTVTKSVKAAA